VNASCVNARVVGAVRARRPACWQACPVGQGHNQSSACWLDCFFDTVLGNASSGLRPMHKTELVAPFLQAFASKDPSNGGCAPAYVDE
jgi:hypothetical protein